MRNRKMRTVSRKSKKGVSPVIATIIIVAIAIVMSISVAYWMLGLGASFTRFEKIEFVTAYAIKGSGANEFNITMSIKNTGSADATIEFDSSMLNGKPSSYYVSLAGHNVTWIWNDKMYYYNGTAWISAYTNGTTITPTEKTVTLVPGKDQSVTLMLKGSSFASGMTLEVMIHTAAGKDYPKVVVLP